MFRYMAHPVGGLSCVPYRCSTGKLALNPTWPHLPSPSPPDQYTVGEGECSFAICTYSTAQQCSRAVQLLVQRRGSCYQLGGGGPPWPRGPGVPPWRPGRQLPRGETFRGVERFLCRRRTNRRARARHVTAADQRPGALRAPRGGPQRHYHPAHRGDQTQPRAAEPRNRRLFSLG